MAKILIKSPKNEKSTFKTLTYFLNEKILFSTFTFDCIQLWKVIILFFGLAPSLSTRSLKIILTRNNIYGGKLQQKIPKNNSTGGQT